MNWLYCLLIGHTLLIASAYGRPDAPPAIATAPSAEAAPIHPDVKLTNAHVSVDRVSSAPVAAASVESKPVLPNKVLRANVVVELAQPNATFHPTGRPAPTAAALTSEFGDKIRTSAPTSTTRHHSSHPSKRYIKNLVFRPRTNLTARYLSNLLPTPIANTLERPSYAVYGTPPAAAHAIALNEDILNRYNNQAINAKIRNAALPNQIILGTPYDVSSPRPDTVLTPAIQSIYQNLNFVSVPPPPSSQSAATEHDLKQALLRDKIQQQIEELNNLGSISITAAGNYQPIGAAEASSSSNAHLKNSLQYIQNVALSQQQQQTQLQRPIYSPAAIDSQKLANVANHFFYTPTTPATSNILLFEPPTTAAPPKLLLLTPPTTTEFDPYKFYERIVLTQNGQQNNNYDREPAPLKQPVIHIGYATKPTKIHLSTNENNNHFDTMTHSHSHKDTSENPQRNKNKTKLYLNNGFVAELNKHGSGNEDVDVGSTINEHNGNYNQNNNKHDDHNDDGNGNQSNSHDDDQRITNNNDANNENNGKKKPTNKNSAGSAADGNNDVKIFINIDDKKKPGSTKDRKGSSHSGNSHGGGNKDKKKRKGMKKPQQAAQTILLQRPYHTTTEQPPKTLTIVAHDKDKDHSKIGYLDKFLHMLPLLSILKPLSFGFWTIALSPLLVVAAGGVAIAVILYPWLTLSQEHQVAAVHRRAPAVVIHKHTSHARRPIVRYRRPVYVRPLRKRRRPHSNSIAWSEHRADTFPWIESMPQTMQSSLEGILEGQFIHRETPKKNLLRREKRDVGYAVAMSQQLADDDENECDREFRNWLLALNNFHSNVFMGR